MFDHKHYVPILKAKEGEFAALKETSNATKDAMTPLLEIVNVPWDYDAEDEAKTIEMHLARVGAKLYDCWGDSRRFFLDSNLIDSDRAMASGSHHLAALFDDFRAKNLLGVPVTAFDRHDDYKAAVKAISDTDRRGICLRLTSADLVDVNLPATVDTALAYFGLAPNDVDLVADFGAIYGMTPTIILASAIAALTTTIPYVSDWRSLTLAASGFPVNLSEIHGNTIDRSIERMEWDIWNDLLARPLPRKPTFADYAVSNPVMTEMDPRLMTISANIRYTADGYWLIMRGQSTRKHGYDQYHKLAAALVTQPEYCGAAYSWGDAYVDACAKKDVGKGNNTIWRKVATSHHFQKVVDQIASLP
jgi:hypothetical protein